MSPAHRSGGAIRAAAWCPGPSGPGHHAVALRRRDPAVPDRIHGQDWNNGLRNTGDRRRMDATATDDATLVAGALAGDRDSFAAIYDRYADRVHTMCIHLLGNRDDAADVCGDVFLTAAERLGQLRDPSRLKPWLFADRPPAGLPADPPPFPRRAGRGGGRREHRDHGRPRGVRCRVLRTGRGGARCRSRPRRHRPPGAGAVPAGPGGLRPGRRPGRVRHQRLPGRPSHEGTPGTFARRAAGGPARPRGLRRPGCGAAGLGRRLLGAVAQARRPPRGRLSDLLRAAAHGPCPAAGGRGRRIPVGHGPGVGAVPCPGWHGPRRRHRPALAR